MLEINFTTKSKDKAEALKACLAEACDAEEGREFSVYADGPSWIVSAGLSGRLHDAVAVIDIDACKDAFTLYTELSGKPSANALTAGIAVRSVNEIQ